MRARTMRARTRAGAALVALALFMAGCGGSEQGHRAPVVPRGLGSLPTTAQGPISAVLGRSDPGYRIVRLHALNAAQRLRLRFGPAGVRIRTGSRSLVVRLAEFGRGDGLQSVQPAAPVPVGNRISYDHGRVKEWYANGPLGLEQGYDVPARPSGSGDLTMAMALTGGLRATAGPTGSVLLSGGGASLRYGGLIATDARGDRLPARVALNGSRLEIRVDDRGAVYPVRVDPFFQQAILTSSTATPGDAFGDAVAVSGDTIAVGAFGADGGKGAVYVFVKPAAGWAAATQTAVLTGSDLTTGDEFAESSVAISGDVIVTGAWDHKVGDQASQGVAYVFVRPAAGWANEHQSAELQSNDGAAGDHFGMSVAISGKVVAVGAPNHGGGQGEGYVFVKPFTGWAGTLTQRGRLEPSNPGAHDLAGVDVAIDGNAVVVGADGRTVGVNTGQGAAFVFNEPSTGWEGQHTEDAELIASDGAPNDGFGSYVAISGATIAASAPNRTVATHIDQGAVYVFTQPGGGWNGTLQQSAELTASDGQSHDLLGGPVSVSDGVILAAAAGHRVGANAHQGIAYAFDEPDAGWSGALTQSAELTAADGAAGDDFGASLSISGATLAVSAEGRKPGGAVYVLHPSTALTIATPANGATYTQGQVLPASFECMPTPPATLTSCAGTAALGAPIDTSTLGPHVLSVTAIDSDGIATTQTSTYTVTSAAPAVVAPVLGAISQSHKKWRTGSRAASIAGRKKSTRPKAPIGTNFTFTLNTAASVRLTFTSSAPGRKVKGRCTAPSRRNKKAKGCKRKVNAAALTLAGHAGIDRIAFDGKLGRRKLKPGRYTARFVAADSAGQSEPRSVSFRIVKP